MREREREPSALGIALDHSNVCLWIVRLGEGAAYLCRLGQQSLLHCLHCPSMRFGASHRGIGCVARLAGRAVPRRPLTCASWHLLCQPCAAAAVRAVHEHRSFHGFAASFLDGRLATNVLGRLEFADGPTALDLRLKPSVGSGVQSGGLGVERLRLECADTNVHKLHFKPRVRATNGAVADAADGGSGDAPKAVALDEPLRRVLCLVPCNGSAAGTLLLSLDRGVGVHERVFIGLRLGLGSNDDVADGFDGIEELSRDGQRRIIGGAGSEFLIYIYVSCSSAGSSCSTLSSCSSCCSDSGCSSIDASDCSDCSFCCSDLGCSTRSGSSCCSCCSCVCC